MDKNVPSIRWFENCIYVSDFDTLELFFKKPYIFAEHLFNIATAENFVEVGGEAAYKDLMQAV